MIRVPEWPIDGMRPGFAELKNEKIKDIVDWFHNGCTEYQRYRMPTMTHFEELRQSIIFPWNLLWKLDFRDKGVSKEIQDILGPGPGAEWVWCPYFSNGEAENAVVGRHAIRAYGVIFSKGEAKWVRKLGMALRAARLAAKILKSFLEEKSRSLAYRGELYRKALRTLAEQFDSHSQQSKTCSTEQSLLARRRSSIRLWAEL